MAAPQYAAAGAGAQSADLFDTPLLVPYPAGISAGDLLLLQIAAVSDGTTIDAISGWSVIYGPDVVGTAGMQWIYAKSASGSESGNLSITGTNNKQASARMYRFTGWLGDPTLADNFEGGATTNGTDSTVEAPSVTTTDVDRLVVAFVAIDDDLAQDAFTGGSGGTWAEAIAEYTQTADTDSGIGLQIATLAAAGTISGGADTLALAGNWIARAFAILPFLSVVVSPTDDITTTGWTATPLWSKIDEDPASPDGTIITATAA